MVTGMDTQITQVQQIGRYHRSGAVLTLAFLVLVSACTSVRSQDLQRRTFIGLDLATHGSKMVVRHIDPGSTAENAGIRVGDILLAIGRIAISDPNQLVLASRAYRAASFVGERQDRAPLPRRLGYLALLRRKRIYSHKSLNRISVWRGF
jgi:predicted metalloprotease with PDZ domain